MNNEFNAELTSTGGAAVTAAADLGRRDAERTPDAYDLDTATSLVVARVRDDEDIKTLSLERFLAAPLNPRGAAVVHDPTDFAAYVLRLADRDHTTVWADLQMGSIVALLDDHANAEFAGWRQHAVRLRMQPDRDWDAWMKLDGERLPQDQFAEHIESMTHTIVRPSAADMLEMVTTFQAKRNVTFRQATRVASGDVQLAYDEETTATAGGKGQIDVPLEFTVRLSPWVTVPPVELTARLRWRISNGSLRIGYALLRADRAKLAAFDTVMATVRKGLTEGERLMPSVPIFLGAPPAPVDPRV